MRYNIKYELGLVRRDYILHTCENEVAMIVYVVTDYSGNVLGVYTKEHKALARKEELQRDVGVGFKVSTVEVNRNGTSD